MMSAGGLVQTG